MFYIVSRPLRFEPTRGLIATATSTKTTKSNRFRLPKQQLCTCIMLFWTFLCHHFTTTTWKCLISRLREDVNTRQRLSLSSWTSIQPVRIQPQEVLPIFDELKEMKQHDYTFEGDVTWDDSRERFWAQHSVATLEQCCNHSKQCRNNVVMLCCAKNRRCEPSRVTSPLNDVFAAVAVAVVFA